eukprot:2566756-Rhodomonas_salina.1
MTTNQSQALEEASMRECVIAGHKLNNTFHLRMEAIRAVKGGGSRKAGAARADGRRRRFVRKRVVATSSAVVTSTVVVLVLLHGPGVPGVGASDQPEGHVHGVYHHLAHLATEAAFEARGWSTSGETGRGYSALFHRMRSSNACRYGGRLAMALCKAFGQRGLAQADQVRADDLRHSDGDDRACSAGTEGRSVDGGLNLG